MTAWKFYIPDDGDTAEDARKIKTAEWQPVKGWQADDWAAQAAEQYWSDGGFDSGIDHTVNATVVAPDETETRWTFSFEATVECRADPVEDPQA